MRDKLTIRQDSSNLVERLFRVTTFQPLEHAAGGRGFDAHSCHLSVVGGRVCEGEVGNAYYRPSKAEALDR